MNTRRREGKPNPARDAERVRLQFLEAALSSSNEGVLIVDAEARLVFLNEAGRRMLRRQPSPHIPIPQQAQAMGIRYLDGRLVTPEDSPLLRALAGEAVRDLPLLIAGPDGRELSISGSMSPVRDEQGKIIGAVSIYRDVTVHSRVERALRQVNFTLHLYEQMVQNSPDPMLIVDRQYVFRVVNHAYLRYRAVTLEQVIGHRIEEIVGPEVFEHSIHPDLDAALAGTPSSRTLWVEYPGIGNRYVEFRHYPLFTDGQIDYVVVLIHDLTKRKVAEDALQESESRFRAIFEKGPLGMALVGLDYRLALVNPRMADMLGYEPQEMIGRTLADILHPEDVARGTELAGQLLRGEIPYYTTEKRYIKKNGDFLWGRLTSSLVRNAEGEPRYFLGMLEDVTGRHEATVQREEVLAAERRARQFVEAALHTREEFLAVAAHELKTPITSLRGYAQLTMKRMDTGRLRDPTEIRRTLEIIDRQAARLAIVVAQMLDVSRLDAGELPLNRAWVDVVRITREVVDTMQADATRHTLTLEAPHVLPAFVDARRVKQVLYNLVDNAIKYSPQGGPVQVRVWSSDPQTVCISVRDYGIGIPPEQRAQLFTRFFKAGAQRPAGGLGLGLYVSRRIIELHRGTITADFPADGGSRFTVTLPRNYEAAPSGGERP